MMVGLCEISFHLPGIRSLKAKRGIVRKIIDRTRAKYDVSIAETADHDVYQRANIGFALVGNDSRKLDSRLDELLTFIEELYVAQIIDVEREIFAWRELSSY